VLPRIYCDLSFDLNVGRGMFRLVELPGCWKASFYDLPLTFSLNEGPL